MKVFRILPIVLIFVLLLGGCGEDPNRVETKWYGETVIVDFDLGRAFAGSEVYNFSVERDYSTGKVTDVHVAVNSKNVIPQKDMKALILEASAQLPDSSRKTSPDLVSGIFVIAISAVGIIIGLIQLTNPEGWWDFRLTFGGSWMFKNEHLLEPSDAGLSWIRVQGGIMILICMFAALIGIFMILNPPR